MTNSIFHRGKGSEGLASRIEPVKACQNEEVGVDGCSLLLGGEEDEKMVMVMMTTMAMMQAWRAGEGL